MNQTVQPRNPPFWPKTSPRLARDTCCFWYTTFVDLIYKGHKSTYRINRYVLFCKCYWCSAVFIITLFIFKVRSPMRWWTRKYPIPQKFQDTHILCYICITIICIGFLLGLDIVIIYVSKIILKFDIHRITNSEATDGREYGSKYDVTVWRVLGSRLLIGVRVVQWHSRVQSSMTLKRSKYIYWFLAVHCSVCLMH